MDIKPTIARMGNELNSTQTTDKKAVNSASSPNKAEVSSGISSNQAPDLTLTDTAKNLLDLQSSVGSVEDVDLEKVDAIRKSIENGTYEVDSAKLADNLIQSSLD